MKKFLFLASALCLIACKNPEAPKPVGALPPSYQLPWHEMEYYAFIHFNMNTFTDMEWGTGGEDPALFNPTELDVNQWVKVIKDAGMKGVIITAKHHDGFCLWPSKYTEHSVKNSPWKNGKGDVIRELSDACKKAGLKFGVYLSPWDRNHAEYGRPEYVTYFHNQLRELLTNYGEIFEVWFDGANGGSGYYGGANETRTINAHTYYQWDKTFAIVRELQPNASIFGDEGPNIRWIGNELGYGTPTNWNPFTSNPSLQGKDHLHHLGEGDENGINWIPAEADVSIRPGWYYHTREDHQVRPLEKMVDIYYASVGRGYNLLLNLPVDRRGLVHENDIKRLMELKKVIEADFAHNLVTDASVTASNIRENHKFFSAEKTIDNDKNTYWATDEGVTEASIDINFTKPTTFNRFMAQEYIPLGQRVKKFKLEYQKDRKWETIDEQTTIGYKRLLRFPPVTATKVRFTILDAKASPLISNIGLYNAPALLVTPQFSRDKNEQVTLTPADESTEIFYTLDGSKPNDKSLRYTTPFSVTHPTTLKFVAYDQSKKLYSEVASYSLDIPKTKWKVLSTINDIQKIVDEDPISWFIQEKSKTPTAVTIDLGELLNLKGFIYLPSQDRWAEGTISHYIFEVSTDNVHWKKVSEGEFGNIKNNPIEQRITFAEEKARYIKLTAVKTVDDTNRVSYAEIGIITQ
ncbi:alpha-L-fucosidase [Capnocytophaga sputigena]|uniref:alpha-L-fucosidase n=1 Tax=Capnocytophaga sputigena TaxID=1019 RepID=UPI00288A3013|nr:alpha-L-fucosidase [Capnocytophaga sputigena]